MEVQAVTNGASRADNGTVPGLCGSFESWLTTNVSRLWRPVPPAPVRRLLGGVVAAPTDGTTTSRAFTETLLKTVLAACTLRRQALDPVARHVAEAGVLGLHRPVVLARDHPSKAKEMVQIVGAADIYVSDYGA
jgi:hypothetical protein